MISQSCKILLILSLLVSLPAFSEAANKAVSSPDMVISTHKGKFNGKTVNYKVMAGDTHLLDAKGEPQASIFSTAYIKTNDKDSESRPIIFVFNGGPGSSSVWLHMGVFGPKYVELPSDAEPVSAAPFRVIDNPHSLLDVADLVFIDPVGTGYSKAIGEYEGNDFWGVKEDAEIMSEFVRRFITQHERWNSPKYLAGESYGTTRAGAMVRELQEGWGSIDLNGVFLISSIVDFQTGDFTDGNDIPYITFLPTYAATAWYHNVVPNKQKWASLEAFVDDVRQFALNEYTEFLFKGQRASEQESQAILAQLHEFTGLSKRFITNSNMRINEFYFMKELLRDRGQVVGRLDSRYLGTETNNVEARFDADPSGYAIDGAYTAAIQNYLAKNLNVKRNEPYHILSSEVFSNWNWLYGSSPRQQGFLNVTPHLATAQHQNKDFRIFVANGYYDLATPFFATEHSMNHHGIIKEKVTMKYYPAGHMMYIHHPSLKQLATDMREFVQQGQN
ncbi:peptidase S10 [Glaciecola sp. MH2013]|uniref:S10 family peptidase n=1 Tax=Glaciecola sp. MH2013 TaxID=2785524 RepID=UPI00189E3FF1|nr:peptidase S10 [Glaciecola sp. MH2013]MBF7074337.1 peptidase S10 [Glaciecola sp. MH2013]